MYIDMPMQAEARRQCWMSCSIIFYLFPLRCLTEPRACHLFGKARCSASLARIMSWRSVWAAITSKTLSQNQKIKANVPWMWCTPLVPTLVRQRAQEFGLDWMFMRHDLMKSKWPWTPVAKDDLKLMIFLPRPPRSCDFRCVLPCLAWGSIVCISP